MAIGSVWRWLWAQTLRGLLLLVPVVVTVVFVVWLTRTVETSLRPVVGVFLPPEWYVPGLAMVLFVATAFVLGVLTRHVLMRKVVEILEGWMSRAPVIGSIYPVVRQLTDLLADKDKNQNGKVVLVELPDVGAHVLGIITQPGGTTGINGLPPDCDLVYVPLSYQVGGLMLIMPRSRLQLLDIKPGEALQTILMGGMVQPKAAPRA